MNQDRQRPQPTQRQLSPQGRLVNSYYGLLGVHASASVIEIRRAYRELSKRYHPDTTTLPSAIAIAKFQQLNEAYATLSNPERRSNYDNKIGYSRLNVIQVPQDPAQTHANAKNQLFSNSAYLDPTDRPLSTGELFALFILGATFLGCLLLAIFIGLTRGDAAFQIPTVSLTPVTQSERVRLTSPLYSQLTPSYATLVEMDSLSSSLNAPFIP
ncbi:J domain-containing protein [Lusitaniella coriacea LEGE 07157]|uniref:J domain-containing protein n=1 Tax=Lusitaniella coriacea LEGE 07157 TaxID=945747 RepID=A0A8J7B8F6_9CYAN|nr:J domain-containing protein [Lusitaniella coriacea]MBE9114448.1 J domain-containing protein [Lusitaniella coriacea LEGE 07157]